MRNTRLWRAIPAAAVAAVLSLVSAAPAGADLYSKSSPRQVTPTGWVKLAPPGRAVPVRGAIQYHDGPVAVGTTHVYLIWYGTWVDPSQQQIITDFVSNLGGSEYFRINTTYADGSGYPVANAVQLSGVTEDPYSVGFSLDELQVEVAALMPMVGSAAVFPKDPSGVYIVLGSADVTVTSGLDTQYCAYHGFTSLDGVGIRYAFVGDPSRNPTGCEPQATSPNGNAAADGMVNLVAHLLNETATDPQFSGWYDAKGNENADKCAWTFGDTYTVANDSRANVKLGTRDYLVQQNWVNSSAATGGYCALALPAP